MEIQEKVGSLERRNEICRLFQYEENMRFYVINSHIVPIIPVSSFRDFQIYILLLMNMRASKVKI
jgi:hypothetical protein